MPLHIYTMLRLCASMCVFIGMRGCKYACKRMRVYVYVHIHVLVFMHGVIIRACNESARVPLYMYMRAWVHASMHVCTRTRQCVGKRACARERM